VRRAILETFAASVAAKRQFARENLGALVEVIELVAEALRGGHKLLLFGNGGSAADAQHIAAEFVNRFKIERVPLPAIALTTDTSALTSIANDYGYAQVFAKQVCALGRPGDVALAISTSGNAVNVLRAVAACKRLEIRTVGLTGGSGGKLAHAADVVLQVAATSDTARIQETHILIGHVICEQVDALLFGPKALRGSAKVEKRPGSPFETAAERRRPPQGDRRNAPKK
jgi:D-sedoheptulose 7-phosphate isomerase